jgi:hypothetical protein
VSRSSASSKRTPAAKFEEVRESLGGAVLRVDGASQSDRDGMSLVAYSNQRYSQPAGAQGRSTGQAGFVDRLVAIARVALSERRAPASVSSLIVLSRMVVPSPPSEG